MFPLIISTACGQYFAVFEYFGSGHVSKFPSFIALSHVDLTGNPSATCMYRTSASTLGRSYALYSEGVIFLFGVCCISNSLVCFRANRHSLVSFFYLQPVRVGLHSGDKSVTSCLVNTTVQFALQIGPTPTSVLVKEGMMYPVVGNSGVNCRVGSVAVDDDLSTFSFAVTALICEAIVLGVPCGADGAMYRCVASESTMSVFFCGRIIGEAGVCI